jgi:hypothetical protein
MGFNSTRSLHLSQIKETPSTQKIMKKIIDSIVHTFSKPKKIEEDRSLTDSKLIKTKKLSKDIKDAEQYINNIFTFIETAPQKPEEELLTNIQKTR